MSDQVGEQRPAARASGHLRRSDTMDSVIRDWADCLHSYKEFWVYETMDGSLILGTLWLTARSYSLPPDLEASMHLETLATQ